jgi:hypothetical protein
MSMVLLFLFSPDTMKTIELADTYVESVDDHPTNAFVQAPEGCSKRIIEEMFKLFFINDDEGKQYHSFAFSTSEECNEWLTALEECGCDVRAISQMSNTTSAPPPLKPPFSIDGDDYDMNDIDEDSFVPSPEDLASEKMSDNMQDVYCEDEEDDLFDEAPRQVDEPPSDLDEDDETKLWGNCESFDDKNTQPIMSVRDRVPHQHIYPHMSPPASAIDSPQSSVASSVVTKDDHPHAHLFELLDRAGSGEINQTEFMVGVRRRDEVAKVRPMYMLLIVGQSIVFLMILNAVVYL